MKTVSVIVSGVASGENVQEATIEPGVTAGRLLEKLGLNEYVLSREGSGQAYAENEEIYGSVVEGGKLRATPLADVGENSRARRAGRWI